MSHKLNEFAPSVDYIIVGAVSRGCVLAKVRHGTSFASDVVSRLPKL